MPFRKKDDDSSEEETLVEKRSDLIIGADGAHSALRQTLLKRPMTNFSQKYIQHGYIELYIPATDKGEVRGDKWGQYLKMQKEFSKIISIFSLHWKRIISTSGRETDSCLSPSQIWTDPSP